MNNPTDTTYRTSELNIIALLMASECTIHRLERTGRSGKKVFFHFLNPNRCEKIEREYYNNEATVSAKTYAESMDSAKQLIYQEIEKGVA
jgi:hypothetical protein